MRYLSEKRKTIQVLSIRSIRSSSNASRVSGLRSCCSLGAHHKLDQKKSNDSKNGWIVYCRRILFSSSISILHKGVFLCSALAMFTKVAIGRHVRGVVVTPNNVHLSRLIIKK